jgi:hypothetical protein
LHIIYIKRYKRRLLFVASIFLLWLLMFLISNLITNHNLIFNITIHDYFSFSYPYQLEVDNIYINNRLSTKSTMAFSSFKRPHTQSFSSYKSLQGKFSFNYPTSFNLNQQDFLGSDILYHINFNSKTSSGHGFVQVWNQPYPLKDFLDSSKNVSQLNYKSFTSKPVTVNGLPGYYWDYSIFDKNGQIIKSSEVFLKKNDKMYRISYFIPENLWNENQANLFWNIVNSFKVY